MLKILDEKIRKTPENIEKEYPNCKYLITNFTDIQRQTQQKMLFNTTPPYPSIFDSYISS